MVLAKLAGRKTQTRRIIKHDRGADRIYWHKGVTHWWKGKPPQPYEGWVAHVDKLNGLLLPITCPYGEPGDRLWGRETWRYHGGREYEYQKERGAVRYRADHFDPSNARLSIAEDFEWRPSIFMPRWASRLLDEVASVRVERLQDISDADCLAEGVAEVAGLGVPEYRWPTGAQTFLDPRGAYLTGWDTINGKGAAAKNPFVWVITTKR